MAVKLPRFLRSIPIAQSNGTPSLAFHQWWDTTLKQIEKSITDIQLALTAAGIALDQSGQALTVAIREVSASGPVLESDYIVLVDATSGAVTLDLPAAADNEGTLVTVKKLDSSVNAITVDANASETIDGTATKTLSTQYETLRLVCDGTEWWVI